MACGTTSKADGAVHLHRILTGLDQPVYLTAAPNDSRLFIVQKTGKILVDRGGRLLARPFLNLSAKVSKGGEQGLLSMAFDPHYAKNGYFYVSYTNLNGDNRIVRYRVQRLHPNLASPTSGKILLKLHQPFDNHNGGDIAFGPDGLLYAGFGDGGSGGDPNHNGQRRTGLLSKIVRMNVYAKKPVARMYAFGFRNPWRFSFDRANGNMWIGDVGQDLWEEVDRIPAGTPAGRELRLELLRGHPPLQRRQRQSQADDPGGLPIGAVPAHARHRPGQLLGHRRLCVPRPRPAVDPRLLPVRRLLLRADLATASRRRPPVRDGNLPQGDQHQLVRPGLGGRPVRDIAERLDLPDRVLAQRRRGPLDSVDQAAGANVGGDRLDLGRERPVTVEMR